MFNGIIKNTGVIKYIKRNSNSMIIKVKSKLKIKSNMLGSSISCDGVCLTLTATRKKLLTFYLSQETIKRSNFSNSKVGQILNMEKSLKFGDEIGGHYVYGHIDTLIPIIKIKEINNSWDFEFSLSQLNNQPKFNNMIVEKGSVAINGISLTVANVYENSFNVSIIPHTFQNTNFSLLSENDMVNIEFDPLARYLSKYNDK